MKLKMSHRVYSKNSSGACCAHFLKSCEHLTSPPCKQRPVLRSVCCEHELHKLTMFVTQIPAERKLVLPNITFVSSEFGLLNYAGYWKICMEM